MLVAMPMIVMDQSLSLPPFSSAFQEACKSAAKRTMVAMGRVIQASAVHNVLPRAGSRRAALRCR